MRNIGFLFLRRSFNSSGRADRGATRAGGEQTAPAGPGAEKAAKVAQILNLSPTQKSQLTPILEAEAPKVQAINQDPNLSPSEKKEKLKAVHSQTDPLVKSILTPPNTSSGK